MRMEAWWKTRLESEAGWEDYKVQCEFAWKEYTGEYEDGWIENGLDMRDHILIGAKEDFESTNSVAEIGRAHV